MTTLNDLATETSALTEAREKACNKPMFTGPDQPDDCECGLEETEHFALIGRSKDGTNAIAIITHDQYCEANRDFILNAFNSKSIRVLPELMKVAEAAKEWEIDNWEQGIQTHHDLIVALADLARKLETL